MIVFKTYLKLIFRNKATIFINLLVFLGISLFFAMSQTTQSFDEDSYKNIDVAYIKSDASEKNKGLVDYLAKSYTLTEIDQDEKRIKDGLFYGEFDYIVDISKDDYSSYQVPNSTNAYVVKSSINNYLNTYKQYQSAYPDKDQKFIADKVLNNLSNKVKVVNVSGNESNSLPNLVRFFDMYVYGLIGCLIGGIGVVMVVLNNKKISQRTAVSSINLKTRNFSLYLGHVCLALFLWSVMSIVSFIYFSSTAMSVQHQMLLINSLVFVLPATALAYMVSQLVKGYEAISAVTNILTLGLCFLSGVFIPQMYLNDFVLKMASLFPPYWFVLNNDKIIELNTFDLGPLLPGMAVQILFAVAFIAVGLAISKYKTKNSID